MATKEIQILNANFFALRIRDFQKRLDNNEDNLILAALRRRETSVLKRYAEGKVDITEDAAEVFGRFLEMFGHDKNGNETPAGAAARERYEREVQGKNDQEIEVEIEDENENDEDIVLPVITKQKIEQDLELYQNAVTEYGANSQEAKQIASDAMIWIAAYAENRADLDSDAFETFVDYLETFGNDENGDPSNHAEMAFVRFKQEVARRENDVQYEITEKRKRSPNSDTNQYIMDRVAVAVYLDMGLITKEQHDKSSVQDTIKVLNSVPDLKGKKATEFSERFIDRIISNEQLFMLCPPKTLAYAYEGIKHQLENPKVKNKDVLKARLAQIGARMDDLSAQFSTRSGMFFADQTNIADIYDGYNHMFDVRRPDLDEAKDADKIQAIDTNKKILEDFITEYDRRWGLNDLTPEDAEKLSKKWDELVKRVDKVQLSPETMRLAAKYHFLDKDGKPIPQFKDKDGNPSDTYEDGFTLDENGRLKRVIDLARHDVVMQTVGRKEEVDDATLESELNDQVPLKLFEIDTADKVVQGALEDPNQFTDPQHLQEFVQNLDQNGGEISDNGYQSAMDEQVNKTAGWAGRLKQKLKDGASKVGNFFGKVFKPIRDIDKRAEARTKGGDATPESKRKSRIDFFLRILKGFGSAFLVSATLTVIATAAAAMTGVGLAVSLATIGVITSIAVSAFQIYKWRKAQKEAGQPADLTTLLKDKRMLATLGTTALAAIAMTFGAAGLSQAAMALGFGAMALGGTNNALAMYKDAKSKGFSTKESLTWAFANAAAIVAGGFAGRFAANAAINAYNESHPDNTLFQQKETHTEIRHEETTNTHEVYNDDALRNAERICKMWYQDNPAELQHRVDLINQYNIEHGTHIDPYRAIMINADAGGHTFDNMALHVDGGGVVHSHGQHTVMTDAWGAKYGFSHDDLMAMRHMFQPDGTINDAGMQAAIRADHIVSNINEVGTLNGSRPHYDGVLHQNTVDANGTPVYDTYANGNSVFHTVTDVIVNDVPIDVTTYVPVDVPYTMGMFGVHYPRSKKEFQQLREQVGSQADRIVEERTPIDPVIPPVPPVPPRKKRKQLPPHEEHKQLPGGEERKQLPPHEEHKQLPGDKERKQLPPHEERKQLPEPHQPLPLPPNKQQEPLPVHEVVEDDYMDVLIEEYEKFHGKNSWRALSPDQKKRYEDMVRADWAREPDPAKYTSLKDYIWHRLFEFDEKIRIIIDPVNRRSNPKKEFEVIAQTRQDILKSNANFSNLTLQDFQEAMIVSMSNDHTRDVLRMSQDPKKGPIVHKRKDKRFQAGTYALEAKIIQYEEYLKAEKEKKKQLLKQQMTQQGGNEQ